jgi:Protein of unknown function (DUF1638)
MSTELKLPLVVVACRVFDGILDNYLPKNLTNDIIFLDYGLHSTPKRLKGAIQTQIDSLELPSLVVLGYGLCGNGLDGIHSGKHIILVPRTDDCIALLLGSYQAYRREFDAVPGTYYLTKGWLESGSNPLQEYQEYVQKYGSATADWIMDQQYRHYKRLALVAYSQEDLDHYRAQAKEVAKYCQRWGLRYEEIQGSDEYLRHLIDIAMNLEKADAEFNVIPPGGMIQQSQFIRTG